MLDVVRGRALAAAATHELSTGGFAAGSPHSPCATPPMDNSTFDG
jgi:hypothetical protein